MEESGEEISGAGEEHQAHSQEPSPAQLARCLFVPLLGFVAFTLVFSPQYLIWLLPLAALTAGTGAIRQLWPLRARRC